MEKSTNQKIQLGIFVILGLAIFVAAIYFVGNKQNMFGKTTQLTAVFNNVNGLQLGNSVRYSGINVGTVREISMINDTVIRVTMIIEDKIIPHIKKNAIATITSDGLVGNMIINIIPGKGNDLPVQPEDEIRTYSRIRTDDILETLNVTNENAALLTADLLKITKQITQGKGTVGLLINDTLLAKDLKETMHYLKISGKGTSEAVQNLNKLIASLNDQNNVVGVLKDTAVANSIKKIIVNLEQSSGEMEKVITNLDATITNIKEGKGALNYLSNDPKLVQQIDSTMLNLNQASIKLNEDLEAMKHNFLLRGYFKKLEKEKAKANKK
ncbi:MlaD family protein [Flavobacterium sp.]|uniref:MlaD family protein n=1 Tax=Flavobacterium sp. TaxID=239 RepID=UPI0025C0C2B3|nr:MlaD family protein [Flavobacterium sp.]MBA4154138.1 MCE family protein [Flavobacterium sp.]